MDGSGWKRMEADGSGWKRMEATYDEFSLAKRLELLWLADLRARRGEAGVRSEEEGAARSDCDDSDPRM